MATGLSSNLDPFRKVLEQNVLALEASIDARLRTIQALQIKKDTHTPESVSCSSQLKLDQIHALYQEWIQASIMNIQAQIGLEQEKKALFQGPIDLATLPEACIAIEHQQMSLLQLQKIYEVRIKKFEDRIAEFIQPNHQVEVDFFTMK